jgi:hypothetical protein
MAMNTIKITETITMAKATMSRFLFDNLKPFLKNIISVLFVPSKTMNVSHRT